jgi:peptide/nickel transport system substrate-binding protein
MSEQKISNSFGKQTRRDFLATAAAAGVAGAAVASVPGAAFAAKHKGGTLRFSTRSDSRGLDPHRNVIYYVSHPLAATSGGLLDIDKNMDIVPAIGEEWTVSDDMMTYTFKIRKGVTFHNGADVDSPAIKWNYDRVRDPKTSHSFHRGFFKEVKEITAPRQAHVADRFENAKRGVSGQRYLLSGQSDRAQCRGSCGYPSHRLRTLQIR